MTEVHSVEEMNTFVDSFCNDLQEGDIVVLDGDLGAGKTHFVKAAAKHFNVTEDVTSPTFPIIIEYHGDLPIYHFDLYRLQHSDELYNIGFYDYINSDGISFVEWAIKFPKEIPNYAIYVKINILNDESREITVSKWKDVKETSI